MTCHILKVMLAHVRPPIWRRLAVPSDTSLARLHAALQVAFGWRDSHLHEFRVGELRYGVPDPDEGDSLRDEAEVTVAEALPRKSSSAQYTYDFGDSWIHHVTVDRIEADAPAGSRSLRPRRRAGTIECLDGARAGPPEDCGGPAGYTDLLAALANTSLPQHAEMREWIGGEFNAERFDIADINRRLARIA